MARLALALLVVTACGHPQPRPPAIVPLPITRPAPWRDPARASCGERDRGQLESSRGYLWFRLDVRPEDRSQGDSWGNSPVLLSSQRPLNWGALVGTEDGAGAWGVAARDVEQVSPMAAGDTLYQLRLDDLTATARWHGAGELRLLGRVGTRAIVVASEPEGEVLLAIGPTGAPLRSARLGHLAGLLPQLDAGPPFAAPLGPDAFVLLCGAADVCVAQVLPDRISIEHVALAATGFAFDDAGPRTQLELASGGCIAADGTPSSWPGRVPGACPYDVKYESSAVAFADGRAVLAVTAAIRACLVRDRVDLPAPEADRAVPEATSAGLIVLPHPGVLPLDFLAHGRTVRVGWVNVEPDSPSFGVALRPGTVRIRPITLDGQVVFRVHIDVPLDFDTGSQCNEGWLTTVVTGFGPDYPDEARERSYLEFGKCE